MGAELRTETTAIRTPSPSGPGNAARADLVRRADGILIEISGVWSLSAATPSPKKLEDALRASADARRLAFDSRGLGRWDSSLVALVDRVTATAAELGLEVDQSGLPEGVVRLLDLARAVPARTTGGGTRRESFLARVGNAALELRGRAGETVAFVGELVVAFARLVTFRARFRTVDLAQFLQECGASALPIVTLISFLVGVILAFVGAVQLEQFGAQIYVADLVGLAMVRQMGALMAAIIMAGRTGAAFAAQIGSMKVNEEVDALATMGIPPLEFLVLPRVLALVLMMPLLCLYADFLGIVGGLVVGTGMLGLSFNQYVNQTVNAVHLADCVPGLIMSVFFGALVGIFGCLRGMQCAGSSSAVGDAATSAVVSGIVSIIVADAIFTVIFNVLGI